ncbi:hypothetical protein K2X30_03365 [bacterium]|jgi:hypothetical protein|nr:hypothetical protein [bacterium]
MNKLVRLVGISSLVLMALPGTGAFAWETHKIRVNIAGQSWADGWISANDVSCGRSNSLTYRNYHQNWEGNYTFVSDRACWGFKELVENAAGGCPIHLILSASERTVQGGYQSCEGPAYQHPHHHQAPQPLRVETAPAPAPAPVQVYIPQPVPVYIPQPAPVARYYYERPTPSESPVRGSVVRSGYYNGEPTEQAREFGRQ